MGAVGNGNNQWEWEGNGNKTGRHLGSGMGMGMNHREWEGMGLKKTFPALLSTVVVAALGGRSKYAPCHISTFLGRLDVVTKKHRREA